MSADPLDFLAACLDCYLVCAGNAAHLAPSRAAALGKKLAKHGALVCGRPMGYSWRPCEVCGAKAKGDRFRLQRK